MKLREIIDIIGKIEDVGGGRLADSAFNQICEGFCCTNEKTLVITSDYSYMDEVIKKALKNTDRVESFDRASNNLTLSNGHLIHFTTIERGPEAWKGRWNDVYIY